MANPKRTNCYGCSKQVCTLIKQASQLATRMRAALWPPTAAKDETSLALPPAPHFHASNPLPSAAETRRNHPVKTRRYHDLHTQGTTQGSHQQSRTAAPSPCTGIPQLPTTASRLCCSRQGRQPAQLPGGHTGLHGILRSRKLRGVSPRVGAVPKGLQVVHVLWGATATEGGRDQRGEGCTPCCRRWELWTKRSFAATQGLLPQQAVSPNECRASPCRTKQAEWMLAGHSALQLGTWVSPVAR